MQAEALINPAMFPNRTSSPTGISVGISISLHCRTLGRREPGRHAPAYGTSAHGRLKSGQSRAGFGKPRFVVRQAHHERGNSLIFSTVSVRPEALEG